jgi:hypothetical protein
VPKRLYYQKLESFLREERMTWSHHGKALDHELEGHITDLALPDP